MERDRDPHPHSRNIPHTWKEHPTGKEVAARVAFSRRESPSRVLRDRKRKTARFHHEPSVYTRVQWILTVIARERVLVHVLKNNFSYVLQTTSKKEQSQSMETLTNSYSKRKLRNLPVAYSPVHSHWRPQTSQH